MPNYVITESVGSRVERVDSYRDLEKHRPGSGRERGREYRTIDGELEEVRTANRTEPHVKKDFIIDPPTIPAPASGTIRALNDQWNTVQIVDDNGSVLAQSLRMARGSQPANGSRIEYGQPMGRMGDQECAGAREHAAGRVAGMKSYAMTQCAMTVRKRRSMVPGTASPRPRTADGRGVFHWTGHDNEDPMTSQTTPIPTPAPAARRIDASRAAILALSLCATLAACDRSAAPTTAAPPAATADAPAATPVADASVEWMPGVDTTVPPPAAETVLAATYGAKADAALPDGRQAAFWRGYAYRAGGQERYTAFVDAVAPSENGMPQPEQQAELAQITYTLRDGAWQPGAAQTDVGRFGGMGRAPEADPGRVELTYAVAPDKALLALPSATVATGGVRVRAYEVFLYAGADGAWRHVGTVQSGVDYSASCRQGPSTPDTECVRNNGSLRFDAPAAGGMPEITVNFTGSTRGDDGAIRPAGPTDTRTYRFDAATATYADSTAQ